MLRLSQGGQRLLALAALCSLAVGIVWSLDAATHVEAYDVVHKVDTWGERGVFSYAPIMADGSGERAMGEPGYFTTDTPRVRVAFEWSLEDPGAQRVTAVGDMRLVVRHEGGAGRAAWTDTTPIAEARLDGGADEAMLLEGEIDLPSTQARIEATPGRDASSAKWTIVANVRFASAPIAEHKGEASAFELPIGYAPPLYTLPSKYDANMAKDHGRTEVAHHEAPSGLAALAAAPVAPALAILGLVGLALTIPAVTREEGIA